MNNLNLAIQLKKGLNELHFGATTDEATKFFGEPDEIEALEKETDEEPDTELWYYDDAGFCLFFEDVAGFELTSVEISNLEATLFGEKVFEMNQDQIIKLMMDNGFSEMYTEDEEWGERLLSFEDALIDFYFENEKLVSINWGAFFSEAE